MVSLNYIDKILNNFNLFIFFYLQEDMVNIESNSFKVSVLNAMITNSSFFRRLWWRRLWRLWRLVNSLKTVIHYDTN